MVYKYVAHRRAFPACLVVACTLTLGITQPAHAAQYAFPVIGPSSFTNDFNAPRSNGPHHATDIIADKHQQIISRTDGVIKYVMYPEASWGFAVVVQADNGYEYWYLHINNDTPGTDDGNGGGMYAYGPDVQVGNRVVKGQLLGYVGDSGNAEDTVSHLHLEVLRPDDTAVNPYNGLLNNSYYPTSPELAYPEVDDEILPSSPTFTGGYTLAFGDLDDDPADELVVGPGKGGRYVKVIEKNGVGVRAFQPNGPDFYGGVDVAVGDVDGDGDNEIVTGAGKGGKYVKVFEADGKLIGRFQPNGPNFYGGVDVATGDMDGDGSDEIITGAGQGGRYVKVFTLDGTRIMTINPYNSKIGVTVATGNLAGDNRAEIITGARRGGGPRINAYDSGGNMLFSHYIYSSSFKGGIRVETGNIDRTDSYDEIITVSQSGGTARTKITKTNGSFVDWTDYFAEEWWRGDYYDLAVSSQDDIYTAMGVDRRSTVRPTTY